MSLDMTTIPDLLVMFCLYIFTLFPRWKKQGADMLLIRTLMYVHFAAVLYLTLLPVLAALPYIREIPYTPMNTVPFIDVRLRRGDYMRQIGLNALLLMPYGFLRPLTREDPASSEPFSGRFSSVWRSSCCSRTPAAPRTSQTSSPTQPAARRGTSFPHGSAR